MSSTLSTFCCSITSFDADGKLDEKAMHAHYARVAAAGPGFYVAGSSPGEGYSLTPQEVDRVLRISVEAAAGRVPVRAMGVEPRSAEEMCTFLKMAQKTGVSAVQIYSLDVGHGWKPRPVELEAYFRRALDLCTLPAIISSHAFMGYNVPIDMLEKLAKDYQNLIGVNLTTPDITHLTEAAERLRPRLEIHVGGPMHALTALALGCNGFLASEASMIPKQCQSVIDHYAAGRYKEAEKAYAGVMALMTGLAVMPGASTRKVKATLRLLGHGGTYLRGPFEPLSQKDLDILAPTVAALARRRNIAELASIKG